jgi:hypothetical protein
MKMTDNEFHRRALEAIRSGPEAMATFWLDHLAQKPHSHMADEILDFDESVTDIIEDTGGAERKKEFEDEDRR